MYPLSFLHFAWAAFSGYGNVCFTFSLYVTALCKIYACIYIYIYAYMCGWSCTLYDGLSWLCERPFLVMSALDLEVWVCAQRDGYRWVFMLYCVHDHCGVIIPIHVTKSVSPCMRCTSICLMLWGTLVCYNMSMLAHVIYTSIKPCKCAIVH